jgi:predicted PurR-regulated permease PerM
LLKYHNALLSWVMSKTSPISISITPGTVVVTAFVLLAFWMAFLLRDLLLVVLTAVILASAIEPMVAWLSKRSLPRVLSVVIIYMVVVLFLASFFYFFLPPLTEEASDFFKTLPTYLETLNVAPLEQLSIGGSEGGSMTEQLLQLQDVMKSTSSGALNAASAVFGGLMSFMLIVVLSFYFAVQEHGLDNFLRLVTPPQHQGYMLDLWKRAQVKIGRWLQGQLLLSLIAGVLVYIGLLALGVPYALLLAIVAAVLELIPVFGSILAAIPAVVLSFIDSGATLAILVIVLYVVVNQLQGNVIYPFVVQKVLGVPPLVVILAIIAGAQLAGFLGILIAVPVAAAVQEWIGDIQKGKERLTYTREDGLVM